MVSCTQCTAYYCIVLLEIEFEIGMHACMHGFPEHNTEHRA